MILGDGDIARVLIDREGALFFACGVSNSSCTDVKELKRERDALVNQTKICLEENLCLFYFGTISKFYATSVYVEHKNYMEEIVRSYFTKHVILRIGNIDWGINPNTFMNKLRSLKAQNIPFDVFDEYRYIINQDDLISLTLSLPINGKLEISAFTKMALVKDLI